VSPKPTLEQEEERLLRELAKDPEVSPAQRLRALEVLDRKAARRAEQPPPLSDEEGAPDPFEDLDELEQRRRGRHR